MALRLTPTGDSEDAQAAMAAAQLAQQTADNARQMVLSDRAKNASTIDELRAAAAQLPTTQQAAAEVHAALQQQIDLLETNLNNVETTPGPRGEPGPAGKDGAAGPTRSMDVRTFRSTPTVRFISEGSATVRVQRS